MSTYISADRLWHEWNLFWYSSSLRLIKLLQGLLHEAGIRTSIYVDDGQVLGSIKDETRQDMEVTPIPAGRMQRNVHLKSLAHRVAARFLMADMEKGNDSSGKPRKKWVHHESIILAPQKQVAHSITLDTKWWRPAGRDATRRPEVMVRLQEIP